MGGCVVPGSNWQEKHDQVLNAIEYGMLSRNETEKRLRQIIEEESASPFNREVDTDKISICNSLLWQLYTHGEIQYADHSGESRRFVEQKYLKWKQRRKTLLWSVRTFVVIIVMVIISTAANLLPSLHWFEITSTQSKRQVAVTVHEISVQSVANAISAYGGKGSLVFSDSSELIRTLGFDPGFPPSLNEEYAPVEYHMSIDPEMIRIGCEYAKKDSDIPTGGAEISIRLTIFTSAENASIEFEQTAEGECFLMDGIPVYKYQNAGKEHYLWVEGLTVVRIQSGVPFEKTEKMINETIAWRKRR